MFINLSFDMRRKKTLVSTMSTKKCQDKDDIHKKIGFGRKKKKHRYSLCSPGSELPCYPDIYISTEKDDNCITTVRRTFSKIKWSKPATMSRYHIKCAEKENICKKPKKQKHRKTLISDSDIEEILINQMESRQKFDNDCYCVDLKKEVCGDHKISDKPLIISDTCKKQYSKNAKKNARMFLDYEPESEFLQKLYRGVRPACCKCYECSFKRIVEPMEYTCRRAAIENPCSECVFPKPYKPCEACEMSNSQYKKHGTCQCKDKMYMCSTLAGDFRRCRITGYNTNICMCDLCRLTNKRQRAGDHEANSEQCETNKNNNTETICTSVNKMSYCDLSEENKMRQHKAMGTELKQTVHHYTDMPYLNENKICTCKKIRENNYFETHCVKCPSKNIPIHKCVHKFELDERLLPKPTNVDCWGQSRCEVCNKPYVAAKYENLKKSDKQCQNPLISNLPNSTSVTFSSGFLSPKSILKSSHRDLQKVPSSKNQYTSSNKKYSYVEQHLPERVDKQTCTSECSRQSAQIGSKICVHTNTESSPVKTKMVSCKSTNTLSAPKLSSESRKINICDNNNIMDLNTDAALMKSKTCNSNRIFEENKKTKIRPLVMPHNTLALRYQKGVF